MDKQIIMRNFSRCAAVYDRHTDIQKSCAKELLKYIHIKTPSNILEVGCGTGHLTVLLSKKYKKARLRAVDISNRMVEIAKGKIKGKGIEFSVEDAEYIARKCEYDLIVSNACFNWFGDLEAVFMRYAKAIKKDGEIVFSFYGPRTYGELDICLRGADRQLSVTAKKFVPYKALRQFLIRHFKDVRIDEKIFEERLPSLLSLLKNIKYSGVRGANNKGFSFGPKFLKRAEADYLKRFGNIRATHQVFFCRASL
jgi:malonyl-CoA O-methyltransferase